MIEFEFSGELMRWQDGSWHFVELDPELSADIRDFSRGMRGGWGSVRVAVTVGATTWHTSLFPSKQRDAFLLPVKAEVRRAEGLEPGTEFTIVLRLGD